MSNTYDASKSWTVHDRLRDLRHRLGLVRHGSKAEMASLLGVSAPRYGQWESGARKPDDRDLRRAIALLGLAEEEALMNYLLDPFGTVAPPSWWSASGPVPKAGDPPRDPRWTSEPAQPGDRPRLSPGDAQALAIETRRAVNLDKMAAAAVEIAKAQAIIHDSLLEDGREAPAIIAAPPAVPWARVATLAGRAFEAREAGDEGALAALAEQLRALVCGSAAVPA